MENYEQKYKEALKIMESLHSVVKYQSSSDALLTSQRKGLWDAEKVIDYIYHHAHVRTFGDIVIDDMSVTEFIETMKKAMED